MVLEFLFGERAVEKHPVLLLVQSMVLASIGIMVGFYLFPNSASLVGLAFTTIGLVPLFQRLLEHEEELEEEHPGGPFSFLARHGEIVEMFGWFFIGLVITYSFWYLVLPLSAETGGNEFCVGTRCMDLPHRDQVFAEQEKSLFSISKIQGKFDLPAAPTKGDCFGAAKNVWSCTQFIFENNGIVLFFAILFSLLYGTGALFLLGWNASIFGVRIGQWAIESQSIGQAFFNGLGLLGHGVPEFLAYFAGAIAGGVISAAITRGHTHTKAFEGIAKDTLALLFISYALLLAAAFIEAIAIVGI